MTYKLQIRQTNIYDAVDGFQLLLRHMEQNRDMLLWADATVAACKTGAGYIFKSSAIYWTGDVSDGTSGGQGSDLLWADCWCTFTSTGVTPLGVTAADDAGI